MTGTGTGIDGQRDPFPIVQTDLPYNTEVLHKRHHQSMACKLMDTFPIEQTDLPLNIDVFHTRHHESMACKLMGNENPSPWYKRTYPTTSRCLKSDITWGEHARGVVRN